MSIMGVTRSEGILPANTRERTYAPWIVSEAEYLMAGEVSVNDEGKVLGRTSKVSADGLTIGTDQWVKQSKSEAGSLAQYLRVKFAKDLKARNLKVSTKYIKGECVAVMLRPIGESDEGTEEGKTDEAAEATDEGDKGADEASAEAAA